MVEVEVGVEVGVEVVWYGSVEYSIQSKCHVVAHSGTRYTYLLLRILPVPNHKVTSYM